MKQALKQKRSPRHVPDLIYRVDGIPYTVNGKKMEVLVKKMMMGDSNINYSSLKDPNLISDYKRILALS